MAAPDRVLVADLGNRFLKLGFVEEGRLGARCCVPVNDALGPRTFPAARAPALAVYASVNPGLDARLEAWVQARFGLEAEKLGRDRPIPLATDCRGVGADRLLNALAALERFAGGAIIVDAGTALTVDAVSPDRRFLGGAILPGPHLGAWALAEGAAQLFRVEPGPPDRAVARTTEDAIRSGLHHGAIGAVARLVGMFRAELDFEPALVFTGGGVPLVLEAFPGAAHCPALTLEGVVAAIS